MSEPSTILDETELAESELFFDDDDATTETELTDTHSVVSALSSTSLTSLKTSSIGEDPASKPAHLPALIAATATPLGLPEWFSSRILETLCPARQGHCTKWQGQYILNGREAISPTTNHNFPLRDRCTMARAPLGRTGLFLEGRLLLLL